ncbi:MAG TPA: PIN domain-containing protein [Chloroflexota bacterium]|nr:PIN domain-containing protein [Chloroflexota bacterium]
MAQRGLILDSGAVLALLRRDRRVRAFLEIARQEGVPVVIPPVVVTQIIRGGPGDAETNRLLRVSFVPFVGERLARIAGRLLGEAGAADAADAQVVAEAVRLSPATILTSDPDDLGRLALSTPGVRIIPI